MNAARSGEWNRAEWLAWIAPREPVMNAARSGEWNKAVAKHGLRLLRPVMNAARSGEWNVIFLTDWKSTPDP